MVNLSARTFVFPIIVKETFGFLSNALYVSYHDLNLIYDSLNLDNGVTLTLSDGTLYTLSMFDALINDTPITASTPTDVVLLLTLKDTLYNMLPLGTLILSLALCTFLICLGWMNIIYPEIGWTFRHALSVDGGEPTRFALSSNRISGFLLVGLSLCFPVLALFNVDRKSVV